MARSRNAKSNSSKAMEAGAVTQKETPKRKGRNSKVKAQKQQPQTANVPPGKGKQGTSASKAKGKTNKKSKALPAKKLTAEELDKQMDDYMMRNEKTAEKILEDQMEEYWAQKGKAKEDEEKEATAEDE
jgi:C-terminal duplication domain of Friend of PRMT1